jgi:hypothetical protein
MEGLALRAKDVSFERRQIVNLAGRDRAVGHAAVFGMLRAFRDDDAQSFNAA